MFVKYHATRVTFFKLPRQKHIKNELYFMSITELPELWSPKSELFFFAKKRVHFIKFRSYTVEAIVQLHLFYASALILHIIVRNVARITSDWSWFSVLK